MNYKRNRRAVNPHVWETEEKPMFVWMNALSNYLMTKIVISLFSAAEGPEWLGCGGSLNTSSEEKNKQHCTASDHYSIPTCFMHLSIPLSLQKILIKDEFGFKGCFFFLHACMTGSCDREKDEAAWHPHTVLHSAFSYSSHSGFYWPHKGCNQDQSLNEK